MGVNLEIGNGTYPITEKPFMIKLPPEFVNLKNNREDLINSVYPIILEVLK